MAVTAPSASRSSLRMTSSCLTATGSSRKPSSVLVRRTASPEGTARGSISLVKGPSIQENGETGASRWPNVHVTAYPFPMRYPSSILSAPNMRASLLATRGFSQITTFIFLHFYCQVIICCLWIILFGDVSSTSRLLWRVSLRSGLSLFSRSSRKAAAYSPCFPQGKGVSGREESP